MMKNDFSEPGSGFYFPAMEIFTEEEIEDSLADFYPDEGFRMDDEGHWIPIEDWIDYDELYYSDDPDEAYSVPAGSRVSLPDSSYHILTEEEELEPF